MVLVANVVPEISTSEIIHGQVEVELILERAMYIDEKRMMNGAENVSFVHDRFNVIFLYDSKHE